MFKSMFLAAAISLSALSPSVAGPECAFAAVEALVNVLQENGGTMTKVDRATHNTIIAKLGPPPVDGDFEFFRADVPNGLSAILVVQGPCINQKIGPMPRELLDTKLGLTGANL